MSAAFDWKDDWIADQIEDRRAELFDRWSTAQVRLEAAMIALEADPLREITEAERERMIVLADEMLDAQLDLRAYQAEHGIG